MAIVADFKGMMPARTAIPRAPAQPKVVPARAPLLGPRVHESSWRSSGASRTAPLSNRVRDPFLILRRRFRRRDPTPEADQLPTDEIYVYGRGYHGTDKHRKCLKGGNKIPAARIFLSMNSTAVPTPPCDRAQGGTPSRAWEPLLRYTAFPSRASRLDRGTAANLEMFV
jgi:hypothetical protein